MPLVRSALSAAIVAAGLVALQATAAGAAEVTLDPQTFDCRDCPQIGQAVVRAAPGEANRLQVARGEAGELQVSDAGAELTAGRGCTAVGAQRVDCPTSVPELRVFVLAGDGDDEVSSSIAVLADGGGGHDRLAGSPLADVLYGGWGRDVLSGGDGDDALQDGRLVSVFFPQWVSALNRFLVADVNVAPVRPAPDVMNGGPGIDTLAYTGRRLGIRADLSRAGRHAGARGERDSLRGLEGLSGTDGADRLFGDDSANLLQGGDGDDLVVGRAGDDELAGAGDSNRVRADEGDDRIVVNSGVNSPPLGRQRVSCGAGRDHVEHLGRQDFAEDDCESVVIFESLALRALLPPPHIRRPPLASIDECIAISHCDMRLEVRLARSPDRRRPRLKGLLLARASGTLPSAIVPDAVPTTLTVRLSGRGSRLLRRYHSLLVRIGLNVSTDSAGGFWGAYLTRLRAPP
jgi:Ca2+-binding RTX toxin-like protein